MTDKEIIEGNAWIAEFICTEQRTVSYWLPVPHKGLSRWFEPYELKYHTSWDWLMPVVEKIRDAPMIEGKVLAQTNRWELICNQLMVADKARIWLAVVEFIKWHNDHAKLLTDVK